jgi:2-dehydropantoate 2-reductase
MEKNIAVLGTGAIGSCVGADLTKGGYNVVLIDQWPAHIEAMKAKGVHIKMATGELHTPVRAYHLCEVCSLHQEFDIVIMTAKSYDSRWMVEFIKPYLKPNGALVCLQNSLNDEWVAPMIGYERDIGAVIELSAEIFEPGLVKRNSDHSHSWFAVGELHGRITPRLKEIAQILRNTATVEETTNIWGAKWSKLVVNSMISVSCAIFGVRDYEVIQSPDMIDITIKLGRETSLVGKTLGYNLEPIFGMTADDFLASTDELLKKTLATLVSHIGKEARSMILQDQLKGRRTEIDYVNGLVARKGREAGIPTPWNEAVTALTQKIEQGTAKATPLNAKILKESVGA